MKESRICMGMPCSIEVIDSGVCQNDFDILFNYFTHIDETFSTYKDTSEISRINKKELTIASASKEVREVFTLCEETKRLTQGFFDITTDTGEYDPSGLVKGLAIHRGAKILHDRGFKNYYVEIAGDIETCGKNKDGQIWSIGIQNPFNTKEIIKVIKGKNIGVATSGIYVRGNHIYNPNDRSDRLKGIVSLTVIGPNIYEADRMATACFAMGKDGIYFLEELPLFEGYMIDEKGIATMTTGFLNYVI